MSATPALIILKTSSETLNAVVGEQKHALRGQLRRAKEGDLLLVAEIQSIGSALVRYGMWFMRQHPASAGETEEIWNGRKWRYIIEGRMCRKFSRPFRPEDEKVSDKNYGRGGGGAVVYVRNDDAEAWRRKGLLLPFLPPLGVN